MAASRSGVLVVDKAAGLTSFDVVALVRRQLRARRVGHAGTLDPGATGVLPVLIGEATKLMPYLADQDKEYDATLRLGVRTDTHDLTGRVVAEAPVPPLERQEVEAAARAYVGRIRQVPPMYSAVHHEGRRLYELARQGREVERAAREVVIHALAVEAVELPRVRLRVTCGKGTYIRALAADLGERLGCGAAVERLIRTRVGPFGLDAALPTAAIGTLGPTLWDRLLPPEAALARWPSVRLDARAAAIFRHGQSVSAPGVVRGALPFVAVHEVGGGFLGVGQLLPGGTVRPARILHADHPGSPVLPA